MTNTNVKVKLLRKSNGEVYISLDDLLIFYYSQLADISPTDKDRESERILLLHLIEETTRMRN